MKHRYIFTRPNTWWVYDTATADDEVLVHILSAEAKPSPIDVLRAVDRIDCRWEYNYEEIPLDHTAVFNKVKPCINDDLYDVDSLIFVYSPDSEHAFDYAPIERGDEQPCNYVPHLFPFVCALRRFGRTNLFCTASRRFVLIDTYTGKIACDTGGMPEFARTDQTPIDAARLLDDGYDYMVVPLRRLDWCDGYLVYDVSHINYISSFGRCVDNPHLVDLVELHGRFVCALQTIDPRSPDDDNDGIPF